MQQQTHQQNQQRKPEPAPVHEGTTVYWFSADEPDYEKAGEYLDQLERDGKLPPNALRATTLFLDQLTEKTRVVVLGRDNAKDKSKKRYVDGETVLDSALAPITERAVISCRDFWSLNVADNPQFGGRIDHGAFVRAVGVKAGPLLPRFRPEQLPGVVTLHYT